MPAWPGPAIGCGTHPLVPICLRQLGPHKYEHCIFGESRREAPWHGPPRAGDHLSRGCRTRRPFFVVAVVLMASAPWVLLQPDQDVRTELNRWFLTFAGSVAITAGVLLVLAQRPRMLIVGLDGPMRVSRDH